MKNNMSQEITEMNEFICELITTAPLAVGETLSDALERNKKASHDAIEKQARRVEDGKEDI